MDLLAKAKNFLEKGKPTLEKMQGLSDRNKKIIMWTVVGVLALALGFFWFKSAGERIHKISEEVKNQMQNIAIPEIDIPTDTDLETNIEE